MPGVQNWYIIYKIGYNFVQARLVRDLCCIVHTIFLSLLLKTVVLLNIYFKAIIHAFSGFFDE